MQLGFVNTNKFSSEIMRKCVENVTYCSEATVTFSCDLREL